MASQLKITRGSAPVVRATVKQNGGVEPMDLTGVDVGIVESSLPFDVYVTVPEPLNGRIDLTFPSTDGVDCSKSYTFRLRIGAAGTPGSFTTPKIEVICL